MLYLYVYNWNCKVLWYSYYDVKKQINGLGKGLLGKTLVPRTHVKSLCPVPLSWDGRRTQGICKSLWTNKLSMQQRTTLKKEDLHLKQGGRQGNNEGLCFDPHMHLWQPQVLVLNFYIYCHSIIYKFLWDIQTWVMLYLTAAGDL